MIYLLKSPFDGGGEIRFRSPLRRGRFCLPKQGKNAAFPRHGSTLLRNAVAKSALYGLHSDPYRGDHSGFAARTTDLLRKPLGSNCAGCTNLQF